MEITDHKRTRRKMVFLIKEKGAANITGRWVSNDERKYGTLINEYWKRQKDENIASISATKETRTQGNSSTNNWKIGFLMLLIFGMIGGATGAAWTKRSPTLGPVYDCQTVKEKNVYAFPSKSECEGDFHRTEAHKFLGKSENTRDRLLE